MSLPACECASRHRWQWVNEYNESPGIKQYRQCIDCGVRYHELYPALKNLAAASTTSVSWFPIREEEV